MTRRLHTEQPLLHNPPPGRFINPTEAAANEFVAPLVSALLYVIGGFLTGLAATIIVIYTGDDLATAAPAIAWGTTTGLTLAGLRLLGVFDVLSQLLDALRATRLDVDTDQDGIEDQDETDAALELFTENGIKAFVKEVMFRRKNWKSRALVPGILTREEYDVLIGDILPTIGVLGEAKRNQTRPLLIQDEAQAMRAIDAYFRRPRRRVWTFTIGNKRVVL